MWLCVYDSKNHIWSIKSLQKRLMSSEPGVRLCTAAYAPKKQKGKENKVILQRIYDLDMKMV